jgi:hypothetical protein
MFHRAFFLWAVVQRVQASEATSGTAGGDETSSRKSSAASFQVPLFRLFSFRVI